MYLLLIVGFIFLIKGADYFVVGSSAIAHLLKVPTVIIGLTIVAMGTSAPEAAVSITAGLASVLGVGLLAHCRVLGWAWTPLRTGHRCPLGHPRRKDGWHPADSLRSQVALDHARILPKYFLMP